MQPELNKCYLLRNYAGHLEEAICTYLKEYEDTSRGTLEKFWMYQFLGYDLEDRRMTRYTLHSKNVQIEDEIENLHFLSISEATGIVTAMKDLYLIGVRTNGEGVFSSVYFKNKGVCYEILHCAMAKEAPYNQSKIDYVYFKKILESDVDYVINHSEVMSCFSKAHDEFVRGKDAYIGIEEIAEVQVATKDGFIKFYNFQSNVKPSPRDIVGFFISGPSTEVCVFDFLTEKSRTRYKNGICVSNDPSRGKTRGPS